MLTDGTVLQNRYRILRKLSDKGGMGLVYLAEDLEMDDTVVVKQSLVSSVKYLRQNKNYRSLTEEELLNHRPRSKTMCSHRHANNPAG